VRPRVLIVDDSLTVRMDIGEALQAAGFDTVLCADLRSAREALGRPGAVLVVLDVLLPDGDGLDFLKELKSTPATARIPVLLLSSQDEVADRVRGMGAGADEYLGKPYDLAQVVARARALLHSDANAAMGSERRVLVIDDSATFRNELKQALEGAGYQVREATTGEEGLALAAADRPDAVVVDGMLPGIDGATVVRRLKSDTVLRGTPCLLLTAAESTEDELRALEAGADAYVRKSDDLDVILARLAALLRGVIATSGEASRSLFGPKRLLAVDDSVTYLQELGSQLRQEGYDVVLAASGEQALALLEVQPVDCILLDLVMPGLSGQDTCRHIKQRTEWRDIPLIMLTSRDDRNAMIEGINAGADDYIAKSADFDVLKARLRAQLRRKHFEDENRHIREKLVLRKYALALEGANRELQSFSYSVAHDLRAPLRSIDGFSQALLEDYADKLDEEGRKYLRFVRESAQHMGQLIDALLMLSQVSRSELHREQVDLSALARATVARLRRSHPQRPVEVIIPERLGDSGDPGLLAIVLDNLLGNAWKFTARRDQPRIELAVSGSAGHPVYSVRDNGAGFDMAFAGKLFGVFQRLHAASDFEGTGVGLATVQRIIGRHGGRVWAKGEVNGGATFSFTLNENENENENEIEKDGVVA
jgi:two-component system NtrC family sensor kinase